MRIHNAEIHITRADPSRHNGRAGFLYAITWDTYRRANKHEVFDTRAKAAEAAGDHLDHLERINSVELPSAADAKTQETSTV